jgi:hypothetical protein
MKALVSTCMIAAMVAVFCAGESGAAGGEDIVLAMPFEEGEGETTMDISPHGNHGTLMENASWGVGKFGNAIHVEPVGYVDAGNDRSLRLFRSDFTLAVWVNMKESRFSRHAFIAQDEGEGGRWILEYSLNGNPTFGIYSLDPIAHGGIETFLHFGGEVQPKTWHQVAMVRRRFRNGLGEEYAFYLDGKLDARFEVDSNLPDPLLPKFREVPPITIGWAEEDIWLDGFIDEVLIAKRAFTAEEITTHFNSGVKGVLGLAVHPEGKSAAVWGAIKANTLR